MTGDLIDIPGDLAWHSGDKDHTLRYDEIIGWYCHTCHVIAEQELRLNRLANPERVRA